MDTQHIRDQRQRSLPTSAMRANAMSSTHPRTTSLPARHRHRSTLRHHATRRLASALLLLLTSLLLVACEVETDPTPTRSTTNDTATPRATATAASRPAATSTPRTTSAAPTATLPADLPVDGLEQATVERVVDGDTLIVWRDGQPDTERLRYIGVDTPESVDPNRPVECHGPEASDANADLVAGAVVWLERDVSDTDQYGRLLRYVYVEHNGDLLFVNQELIRQGMATTVTFPPDTRYTDVLRAAQNEARNAERGLWGACTP